MTTANFKEFSTNWTRPSRSPKSDFYRLVPKGLKKNLAFRKRLLKLGTENPQFAEDIWIMCKRDLLFFVNAFLFIKEPRKGAASKYRLFPWITWPIQDWWLTEAEESYGVENIISPKSREVGCSLMAVALALHRQLFFNDEDIGYASRNEEKVDKVDDPSSLFGKIDVFMKYLPKFLVGKRGTDWDRGPCRFVSRRQRTTGMGYPATGELNMGGRNTAFLQDEVGAYPKGLDSAAMETLRSVTDCQIIFSTLSEDDSKAFNQIIDDADFPGKRLPIAWWNCPPLAAGLYTNDDKGEIVFLDPDFSFPKDYPFRSDVSKPGYLRSPWFDKKTSGMRAAAIARLYNLDRKEGRGQVFDAKVIKSLTEKCADPVCAGRLAYDSETFEAKFERDPLGPLKLWFDPVNGRPPAGMVVAIGADISGGTGASNSTMVAFDRVTNRQVASYATSSLTPKEFAPEVVAMCHWFSDTTDAYLVPEINGGMTGDVFLKEIQRLGQTHFIHVRRKEGEKRDTKTKKLGFWTPQSGPGAILTELMRACEAGECFVSERAVIAEAAQYVWKNGCISHPGVNGPDESDTAKNHGDRAVGAALGWYGCALRPFKPAEAKKKAPEYGTSDWLEQYLEEQQSRHTDAEEFNFS